MFPTQCFICQNSNSHNTIDCEQFKGSKTRLRLLQSLKLCTYCVRHKYTPGTVCPLINLITCGVNNCKQSHIPKLHSEFHPEEPISTQNFLSTSNHIPKQINKKLNQETESVALSTAIVKLLTEETGEIPVRCLIDQCSQACYITENIKTKNC
ncbi:CLUMA_CG017956, isoform A [Clunio marinus]|uniref:CLUMA_CG017956, isoform A n=1 Tax=Clunio marinus TaxID=568069 RepID=A0A1J1J222_9DIPT|nr:CLUMA_CG017956, isoform A [Clunio marinus]